MKKPRLPNGHYNIRTRTYPEGYYKFIKELKEYEKWKKNN